MQVEATASRQASRHATPTQSRPSSAMSGRSTQSIRTEFSYALGPSTTSPYAQSNVSGYNGEIFISSPNPGTISPSYPISEIATAPKTRSMIMANPNVSGYLPFEKSTKVYKLPDEQKGRHITHIEAAERVAAVESHPEVNALRLKVLPVAELVHNYPAPRFSGTLGHEGEQFFNDICDLVDNLCTFKPSYLVRNSTGDLEAAIRYSDNEEYVSLQNRLLNLRHRYKRKHNLDRNQVPSVPEWPQKELCYGRKAFSPAAVLFRNLVDSFLGWFYQRHLEQVAQEQQQEQATADLTSFAGISPPHPTPIQGIEEEADRTIVLPLVKSSTTPAGSPDLAMPEQSPSPVSEQSPSPPPNSVYVYDGIVPRVYNPSIHGREHDLYAKTAPGQYTLLYNASGIPVVDRTQLRLTSPGHISTVASTESPPQAEAETPQEVTNTSVDPTTSQGLYRNPYRSTWAERVGSDYQYTQQQSQSSISPVVSLRTPRKTSHVTMEEVPDPEVPTTPPNHEVGDPADTSTPARIKGRPRRRKVRYYTTEDIPEEPTDSEVQNEVHSNLNPAADYAKRFTSFGRPTKSYEPPVNVTTFTAIVPGSPTHSRISQRTPEAPGAPTNIDTEIFAPKGSRIIPSQHWENTGEITESAPIASLESPITIPKKQEDIAPRSVKGSVLTDHPRLSRKSQLLATQLLSAPTAPERNPQVLINTNPTNFSHNQVPISTQRRTSVAPFLRDMAETNTAIRDLVVTNRRRDTLAERVAQAQGHISQPAVDFGDPDDSSSTDSSDETRSPPRRNLPPNQPPNRPRRVANQANLANANLANAARGPVPAHFDTKLKVSEHIPKWDGNPDKLAEWITKLNELADRSDYVYVQLGDLAPLQFTDEAEDWWYSHSPAWKQQTSTNWDTLKDALMTHFLNQHWFNKTTMEAHKRRYRDGEHSDETPARYIAHKKKLLQRAHEYRRDSELIYAVMQGAPQDWGRVVDISQLETWEQFEIRIKSNESILQGMGRGESARLKHIEHMLERVLSKSKKVSAHYATPKKRKRIVKAQAVDSRPRPKPVTDKPLDHVVSQGKTPKMVNGPPCTWCRSHNHWNNDCPAKKFRTRPRKARAHLVEASEEEYSEESSTEYSEDLIELNSDSESNKENDPKDSEQDFLGPLSQ